MNPEKGKKKKHQFITKDIEILSISNLKTQ